MGTLVTTVISVVVALGVIGGLFVGANLVVDRGSQRIEDRIRPWLFAGPAVLFMLFALIIPAIRTVVLSFSGGSRGEEGFTFDNWTSALQNDNVISFERIGDVVTSRLAIVALVLLVVGLVVARRGAAEEVAGEGSKGFDFGNPLASVALVAALLAVLFAVFSTLRGVIWNNLWWVVVVAGFATALGLGLAVLADRSKNERIAKTLIFMPMAISLVGAAVIWKYVYDTPGSGQAEGLLNVVWPGPPIDFLRGTSSASDTGTIAPWNNFYIMVIMIWIQAGFAMVVLSAAIKGVPSELNEAARVDGANEAQVFWRVVLPQIVSTIVVVVTTLTITVLKIFDLVKATTGGAADTDVLANVVYNELRNGNFTASATFATMILLLVLPIMYVNIRRNRQEMFRMTIAAPPPVVDVPDEAVHPNDEKVGASVHRVLSAVPTTVLWALVVLWTIPSFGLLVTSLRPGSEQFGSGWWTVVTNPSFTFENYQNALFDPPGGSVPFAEAFLNSFAIAIPGTVVPIAIACAAAYAFAWMDFRGRHWIFIGVLAMMAVPLQMSLIPLQQLYTGGAHLTLFGTTFILFPDLDLNNKPIAVWLAHTAFGLPLAIYLLHNYISSLPKDVFEAARIDGANHFGIFWRIVLPLAKPAIAAFAIFQFLWVWNDYLLALVFLSQNRDASPLTVQLVNLVTSRGQGTELLPAAAFISMIVPLIIFFSLQRYFVRGLLAGSVKG